MLSEFICFLQMICLSDLRLPIGIPAAALYHKNILHYSRSLPKFVCRYDFIIFMKANLLLQIIYTLCWTKGLELDIIELCKIIAERAEDSKRR